MLIMSIRASVKEQYLKYLVVSLRPSSTGVFWPTDCLMTQLPSAIRGMILNAPFLSVCVSFSSSLPSRKLHSFRPSCQFKFHIHYECPCLPHLRILQHCCIGLAEGQLSISFAVAFKVAFTVITLSAAADESSRTSQLTFST